jgi:GT2 family glycosyltransferase
MTASAQGSPCSRTGREVGPGRSPDLDLAAGEGGLEAPRVIAVVLNWNNLPDTLECVASLRRSEYPKLDVWVVDNASMEDPTQVLGEQYPGVRVVRNAGNLGYGGGNNAGLRLAIQEGAAYILLMNNDAVVAPDMVRRLVAVMEDDPRVGFATPRVFYYDRPTEVYWEGGTIDWDTGETPHDSRGLPVSGDVRQSEWLDTCVLLARVTAIHDVGPLDERYFLYFEDTEWTLRAARRGWINAVVLPAQAWHKVSRSTGGKANPPIIFYNIRNKYLFITEHSPSRKTLRWKLGYACELWRAYAWLRSQHRSRRAVIAAVLSLSRREWGPYQGPSRKTVLLLDTVILSGLYAALAVKRSARLAKRVLRRLLRTLLPLRARIRSWRPRTRS